MTYELHHIRKRKENALEYEKEKTSILKKTLDNLAYPVAILGPLSSTDQLLRIWHEQSADGVSVLVWAVLLFTSSFWMMYGLIHKERVIFFGHLVWFILSALIIGEIIYFS